MKFQYEASAESLARKLLDLGIFEDSGAVVRMAGTPSELKAAYRLVYREYLRKSYCLPSSSEMQYTFHCFLPETRTFLLQKNEELMGTSTLIPDSPCGLPSESAFPEIRQLCNPKTRLGEIGLLAFDPVFYGPRKPNLSSYRNWAAILPLFKGMFQYALRAGVTDLVIAVLPGLQKFYQTLGFETISAVRPYPLACQDRAVAMRLNIPVWIQTVPADHILKGYFFNDSRRFEEPRYRIEWSAEWVRELLAGKSVPAAAQEYFEKLYPGFLAPC